MPPILPELACFATDQELIIQVGHFNQLYRAGSSPISDAHFDALFAELESRQPNHPLVANVQPASVDSKGRVAHPIPMLSTEKPMKHLRSVHGFRKWQISSVNRWSLVRRLFASLFVVDALEKIFNFKKPYQILGKIADTRPVFSEQVMLGIGEFLVNYKEQHVQPKDVQPKDVPESKSDIKIAPEHRSGLQAVACKHCGVICTGSPMPGRFGYYFKCGKCGGNTSLKDVPCSLCGSADTKTTKRKESYFLECRSCNGTSVLYEGS